MVTEQQNRISSKNNDRTSKAFFVYDLIAASVNQILEDTKRQLNAVPPLE